MREYHIYSWRWITIFKTTTWMITEERERRFPKLNLPCRTSQQNQTALIETSTQLHREMTEHYPSQREVVRTLKKHVLHFSATSADPSMALMVTTVNLMIKQSRQMEIVWQNVNQLFTQVLAFKKDHPIQPQEGTPVTKEGAYQWMNSKVLTSHQTTRYPTQLALAQHDFNKTKEQMWEEAFQPLPDFNPDAKDIALMTWASRVKHGRPLIKLDPTQKMSFHLQ